LFWLCEYLANKSGNCVQLTEKHVADHFGGGSASSARGVASAWQQTDTNPDRPRTKEEVMKEVIAKSKLAKFERQQSKAESETLIHTYVQNKLHAYVCV
jgi:hypothetical protein